MAVLALAAACVAVLALTVLVLRVLDFRRLELAMPGPPSWPLLGNLLELKEVTEANVFATAVRVWGGRAELTRFSIFNKLVVFVTDPDHLAELFRRKDLSDKADFMYRFFDYTCPKGLVPLNGQEHKMHQRAIRPAFRADVLDSYDDLFAEEAERFVRTLAPGEEQEVQDHVMNVLARALLRTTMASNPRPDTEKTIEEVVHCFKAFTRCMNEFTLQPWKQLAFTFTSSFRQLKAYVSQLHEVCRSIMQERKAMLGGAPDGDKDDAEFLKRKTTLLDTLFDAQTSGKFPLKDSDIYDEVFLFLCAAVETTASTLCSVMKLLSIYPDVQDKVYAEVRQVLGASKRSVALDDLGRLEYLERVIKETLRVLPSGPFIARQVPEKTEFAGKVLPAGTTLLINIYGAHRDPRHWTEPLRFDPDRFAENVQRHPYAFLPFSLGSRACIGQRYAVQIMKTVLATTLRDYRIERADDGVTHHDQLHLSFDITLKIVGGTRVAFQPRDDGGTAPKTNES